MPANPEFADAEAAVDLHGIAERVRGDDLDDEVRSRVDAHDDPIVVADLIEIRDVVTLVRLAPVRFEPSSTESVEPNAIISISRPTQMSSMNPASRFFNFSCKVPGDTIVSLPSQYMYLGQLRSPAPRGGLETSTRSAGICCQGSSMVGSVAGHRGSNLKPQSRGWDGVFHKKISYDIS